MNSNIMKNYPVTLGLITLTFICCYGARSQNVTYPQEHDISNAKGEPKDSLTHYFPVLKNRDASKGLHMDMTDWYSYILYAAKEPVLCNYYLGHDEYRFLWLSAWRLPTIISIFKENNRISLNIKQLDREPDWFPARSMKVFIPPVIIPTDSIDQKVNYNSPPEQMKDTVIIPNHHANVIVNKTIVLSIEEWNTFQQLIDSCKFYSMPSQINSRGLDGSEWIIESHQKDKYWFVDRWSPEDNYRKCGEYLIKLSGL